MSENKSVSEVQQSAQDRVKEITDKLEAGLKALFEGDNFKQYLDTMSKFHNYSFNNTMLIALQKPEATLVAGFNSWKNNFERSVNKGEKGIKIFAPAPYKKKKLQEKIDPETELPVLDKDGKPVMEEVTVTIPAFKVVSVFDVSQTNGKELPTLGVDELKGDVENFEKFFGILKEVSPVPIKFDEIDGSAKGFYHQVNKDITINQDMPEAQTIKTAIHEIAHAKLHDHDLKKADIDSPKKDRKTEEVEAESVAYTVCQHFGIDTSDYSFAYVASWGSGKDTPELKASLETIRATASELITQIEDKLRGLEKERTAEKEDVQVSAESKEQPPNEQENNIIGNTPYKDISDKFFIRMSAEKAQEIAAVLEKNGLSFSGRIDGDKATITINKADKETYKWLIMPPKGKLKEYKNEVEKAVSELDNAENAVEIANEKLSLVEQEICEVMDENGDIPDPELKAALMDKLRNAMEFAQNLESHFEDKQINFNMALNNFSGFYVKMKEQEYEGKMPDKTVTLTQMVEYGYSYNPKNEMLPLDTEKATQLFDLGAEVYRLYEDNTEGLVDNKAEIGEHSGLFGIEKAEWEKVQPFAEHMDKILAEQPKREEFLLHGNVPAAGIYQLKENNDTRNLTYLNSKYLDEKGLVPDRENYNLVYSFEVVADDLKNKNSFLDNVFEKYNTEHPEDYLGRSLSVSDVVVIHNGEDLSAHYVDSFGFKELENFGAVHKETAQQEKSTAVKEQPKQTAEKAAKPKAKSKTKAENKPSVLGAIEEIKKNSPKQSNETNEKVNEKGVEL